MTDFKPQIEDDAKVNCAQPADENSEETFDRENDDDTPFEHVQNTLDPIEQAKADKALKAESMTAFARFSTFGIYLLLAIGLGYLIGHWLDKTFNCEPILTIFWVACGVAAAIMELVKSIKLASHIGDQDDPTSMKK